MRRKDCEECETLVQRNEERQTYAEDGERHKKLNVGKNGLQF
jgi:hypothetical protein